MSFRSFAALAGFALVTSALVASPLTACSTSSLAEDLPDGGSGTNGGGTCPCVVGNSGISITIGCGGTGCYELNGVAKGVSCQTDGVHDDPEACTSAGGSLTDGGGSTTTTTFDSGPVDPWSTPIGCGPTTTNPMTGVVDCDGDGVPDATDNCPGVANADQADTNHDGAGDVCETALANCTKVNATANDVGTLDASGLDLRGCRVTLTTVGLEGGADAGSSDGGAAIVFDGANLACTTINLPIAHLSTSFVGATLTNAAVEQESNLPLTFSNGALDGACLEAEGGLTLDHTTFVNGSADGPVTMIAGDATGASFVQNVSVTTNGTTLDHASFSQVTTLAITGGSATAAKFSQVQTATITGADISGATLLETKAGLKDDVVAGTICTAATISCATGNTGMVDASCTSAVSAAPACP